MDDDKKPLFVKVGEEEPKVPWVEKPWVDYQPKRERDKTFYDIMLRDGTIVPCCYPNGVHWNPMFGKLTPKKVGNNPIADYRVIKIRLCEHPMDRDDV